MNGNITNILDVLALTIQLIGSILMYFNSPENVPSGALIEFGDSDFVTPN